MTTHVTTKNILVVEDSLGDAQLIREVFNDLPLVQWHFVQNMTYARDFIHQRAPFHAAPRPDLILLDLHLPICPGFSLIPAVKSDPVLRHIKIIVFTSSHSERDRDMCAQLGADDYIVKPITLPKWTEALAKAIQ